MVDNQGTPQSWPGSETLVHRALDVLHCLALLGHSEHRVGWLAKSRLPHFPLPITFINVKQGYSMGHKVEETSGWDNDTIYSDISDTRRSSEWALWMSIDVNSAGRSARRGP